MRSGTSTKHLSDPLMRVGAEEGCDFEVGDAQSRTTDELLFEEEVCELLQARSLLAGSLQILLLLRSC